MAKKRKKSAARIEHDLLGTKRVAGDAYYGIQTLRAMENFNISGVPLHHYPDLIVGLAMVKMAAARANADAGGSWVGQHPPYLRPEYSWLAQPAVASQVEQFVVGHAAPQKIRKAGSQLQIADGMNRSRRGVGWITLNAE
jgi:hypothetical protein